MQIKYTAKASDIRVQMPWFWKEYNRPKYLSGTRKLALYLIGGN